jgi:hypothetical protein
MRSSLMCEAALSRVQLYRSGTYGKLTWGPPEQKIRCRPVSFAAGPDLYE